VEKTKRKSSKCNSSAASCGGRGAPPLLSAEDVSAEQWADFDEHGYVKLELYVCMYVLCSRFVTV
jgi:hypothetical protein